MILYRETGACSPRNRTGFSEPRWSLVIRNFLPSEAEMKSGFVGGDFAATFVVKKSIHFTGLYEAFAQNEEMDLKS